MAGVAYKHCPHDNAPAYKCADCTAARLREWRERKKASDPEYVVRMRLQARTWNAEHSAERLAYQRKWQAANRERTRYHARKRKAHLRGAEGDGLTPDQWFDLQSYFGNRCAYCLNRPDKLTQDHMIPVSRGGRHDQENLVPACGSCNSAKNARTPLEFLVLTVSKGHTR